MKKVILKNIFTVIIVFFVASLMFSSLLGIGDGSSKEIPLNEVVSKIEGGEIVSILVENEKLEVKDSQGNSFNSVKEEGVSLVESLTSLGVEKDKLENLSIEIKSSDGAGLWFGILINAILPVLLIIGLFWFMSRQAQKSMGQNFSFGKAKVKSIGGEKEKTTFKDVAGLKEAKQELKEVVDFLKNSKKFLEIGARIPRGVLLMGSPGTGKTLLARAVAGEAGVPFFHMSGAEFVEMFVGVGASRVRDVFATAKKASPSILFIDEIDAVGRQRGSGMGGGHDEREQTLNQILVEMDGFDNNSNVIVMAATNRPDVLDPALLRPGRFDRRVILDLPDINEREQILKIHSLKKKMEKEVDLRRIAERTPGFSGADLSNIVNEAAILAARKNKKAFGQEELFESIEKVVMGPERKSRAVSKNEKKIVAYHESGHAIVGHFLKDSDPIQKVSIIARGMAGGYTMSVPTEDRYLKTKSQFLAEMSSLLGGFLAEKIFLGEISTGASNDLKRVSSLARKLVMQFGMSDKLGPITYGRTQEMVFLGGMGTGSERDYSEEIASQIDSEVRKVIDKSMKEAEKVLKKEKTKLELLAETLMEKETIEKDEFDKLMDGKTSKENKVGIKLKKKK